MAILVRKDINHFRHEVEVKLCSVQLCAVTLLLPEARVTIGCVYRSPGTTESDDQSLIAALDLLVQRSAKLYIVGDFNLPNIDWIAGRCNHGDIGADYLEWINSRALCQHVTFNTRFRNGHTPSLLDLVISKSAYDVTSVTNHPPIGKSDHILIQVEIRIRPPKRKMKRVRNFGRINIDDLRGRALGIDWHPREISLGVDEVWSSIKQHLLNLQDEFAPLRYRGHKGKPPR